MFHIVFFYALIAKQCEESSRLFLTTSAPWRPKVIINMLLYLPRPQASLLVRERCAWGCGTVAGGENHQAPRSLFSRSQRRLGTRQLLYFKTNLEHRQKLSRRAMRRLHLWMMMLVTFVCRNLAKLRIVSMQTCKEIRFMFCYDQYVRGKRAGPVSLQPPLCSLCACTSKSHQGQMEIKRCSSLPAYSSAPFTLSASFTLPTPCLPTRNSRIFQSHH